MGAAEKQRRVAFVIGNGNYARANILDNPPNDARAIAKALRELDFHVLDAINKPLPELDPLNTQFLRKCSDADVAVFFFAGHGVQVDGENYLIPIDAILEDETQLRYTLRLVEQINAMSKRARVSILLLDCCRDNPFARSLSMHMIDKTRSAHTGMAPVKSNVDQTTGTLVTFATMSGAVAADGTGDHSPFTTALLQHIRTPGLSINDLMTEVAGSVARSTNWKQRPETATSLVERFYLVPPARDVDESHAGVKRAETHTAPDESWDQSSHDRKIAADKHPHAQDPAQQSSKSGQQSEEVATDGNPSQVAQGNGKKLPIVAIAGIIAVAVLVLVLIAIGGKDPSSVLPEASSIIPRIGDIDSNDMSAGVMMEQAGSLLAGGSEADVKRLATALVRMAADYSLKGLSTGGRGNLITLLDKVDPAIWQEEDLRNVAAEARRAIVNLGAMRASGDLVEGAATDALERLSGKLLKARNLKTIQLSFAASGNGGSVQPGAAQKLLSALEDVGWDAEGPYGTADITAVVKKNGNQVRYGSETNEAISRTAVADLNAAGSSMPGEPTLDATIGDSSIEVWLGETPIFSPDDRWSAEKPVAAWCFQRFDPSNAALPVSVRCHKSHQLCEKNNGGDRPAVRKSECAFVAFLDETDIPLSPGGSDASWYQYFPQAWALPFPPLPK